MKQTAAAAAAVTAIGAAWVAARIGLCGTAQLSLRDGPNAQYYDLTQSDSPLVTSVCYREVFGNALLERRRRFLRPVQVFHNNKALGD